MKSLILFIGTISLLYLLILFFLYFAQESLIFHPQTYPKSYQYQFSTTFEEINIENTQDGITLNTILFHVKKPRGLILYFHGNAGALDTWGTIYPIFNKHDYDVWIIDYRGYGKSTGVIQNEQQLHDDALFFYQAAQKRYPHTEMTIYGRSLGSGVAAKLAYEHPPKQLLLESPYYHFSALVKDIYPFVPSALLRYKLKTNQYIQNVDFPVHLFHGDQDSLIPYQHSEWLEQLGTHITFHKIKGAEHNDISNFRDFDLKLGHILK